MPFGWSGGWPSLSLPSLPNLSAAATSFLTAQWQRRLLLYLVRRSLTGILLLPEDDLEQSTFLKADLSQGRVDLHTVKLDVEVRMYRSCGKPTVRDTHVVRRRPSTRRLKVVSPTKAFGHQSRPGALAKSRSFSGTRRPNVWATFKPIRRTIRTNYT